MDKFETLTLKRSVKFFDERGATIDISGAIDSIKMDQNFETDQTLKNQIKVRRYSLATLSKTTSSNENINRSRRRYFGCFSVIAE